MLRSQEVLTLHDSLNSGLGFLGKGDVGRRELWGGAGGWFGMEGWSLSPAPLARKEGAGRDLRGAPSPRLGNLLGAHLSRADLKALWLQRVRGEGLGKEGTASRSGKPRVQLGRGLGSLVEWPEEVGGLPREEHSDLQE